MNVGDVVQLKSGGPLMTVYAVEGERLDGEPVNRGQVACVWFGDGDKRRQDYFDVKMLVPIAEPIDTE